MSSNDLILLVAEYFGVIAVVTQLKVRVQVAW